MPNSALAELYFIAAMFILISIICAAAVYFFFRTYNREKKARELSKLEKKSPDESAKASK